MAKRPAESPAASRSQSIVEPDQLSSVVGALGELRAQHQVRVYRINDEGHAQAVRNGKFTADKCDEYVIAERFGGGEYRADVVDPQGVIRRQVRVRVPDGVEPMYVEPTPETRNEALGELRAELSEIRDLVRTLRSGTAPAPGGGVDYTGLAALLTALRPTGDNGMKLPDLLALLREQTRTPLGEMMGVVEKLAELRGLAGEVEPEETAPGAPAGDTTERIVSQLIGVLDKFMSKRDGKPATVPPKRVQNEAAPAARSKRGAIDRLALLLATNADAGVEPDATANIVAGFIARNAAELAPAFTRDSSLTAQLIARVPGLRDHEQYVASVEAALDALTPPDQDDGGSEPAGTQQGESNDDAT